MKKEGIVNQHLLGAESEIIIPSVKKFAELLSKKDFTSLAEAANQVLAEEPKWISPQQLFTWANTYLNVKNSIGIVLFMEMVIEYCGARPQDGGSGQYALIAGETVAAGLIMLASNPYNTKPIQDAQAFYGWTLPHKAQKMQRLRVDYWKTGYGGHAAIIGSSLSFAVAQAMLSRQATFYIPASSPIMYAMMAMIGASYVFPSAVRANHALNVLKFMCFGLKSEFNTSLPKSRWPLVPLYLLATLISLPYSYPVGNFLLSLAGQGQEKLGFIGHFALANIVGHPFITPQTGVTADELYKFFSKLSCYNQGTEEGAEACKGGWSSYNILALVISFFAMALTTFALAFKQFESSGIGDVAAFIFAGIAALKFIAQARPMVKHLKRKDGWKDLIVPPAKGSLSYERSIIDKLLKQWGEEKISIIQESPAPRCVGAENTKSLEEKIKHRYGHFLVMTAIANIRKAHSRGESRSMVGIEELRIFAMVRGHGLDACVSHVFERPKEEVAEHIKGVGCATTWCAVAATPLATYQVSSLSDV